MKILAVRHAVPGKRVTNEQLLEVIHEYNRDRLSEHEMAALDRQIQNHLTLTGTKVRYIVDDGESALDHVREAGRQALSAAQVRPEEVEFLIYAGIGRGWIEPATANVVQHELGLVNATGFDLLDACASWLRALHVAHTFIRKGVYRCGLIVNCECGLNQFADLEFCDVNDVDHRLAAFTIGEAATATLVNDENPQDDFYFSFKNFGEHFDLCMIPLSNASAFLPSTNGVREAPLKFYSVSRKLMAVTARKIVDAFEADPKLRDASYDICFGHEASDKVREVIGRKLRLPSDIYFGTHADYGNTVSASIPLGMSLAADQGRLRRGDKTLIIVGSAGISIGFASFTF